MENKAHALIAGIFTIVLLTATIFIGLWLSHDHVVSTAYEIATTLPVSGLNPQAAVRYRGLDVGRVEEISFDPKTTGQILIHISVAPDTPVTKSTYAVLEYQGLTGIAFVELNDDGASQVAVTGNKETIVRIPLHPDFMSQLQSRGTAILDQTEQLTKRFNSLLSPDHQQTMLAAFDNVSKAADKIEVVARELEPTLGKLPALADETNRTMSSVGKLAKDADVLSNNLDLFATQLQAPDGAVTRLSNGIDQFGSMAGKIESEAHPLTHDARTSLRTFNRTLDNFNERPQSILFGATSVAPGPGEPGFTVPGK